MNKSLHFAFRAALLSGVLLTTLPACDVLDQEVPTAFNDPTEAFSTPTRIEQSMIGVYNDLQQQEFLGGRALIYNDVRGGDTDAAAYFTSVATYSQLSTDGYALNSWFGGYRTIFSANSFLQTMQGVNGVVTDATKAKYLGEAKFIRALTYFHLVNLFAQPYNFTADAAHPGVVLQLTAPTTATAAFDPTQRLPRATVKQIYDQMILDLTEAITALPVSTGTTSSTTGVNISRATKGAAQALLSRIYLYKGDYANAATQAAAVITSGKYALNADPLTSFFTSISSTGAVTASTANYVTPESIFSVAMNSADNPNTNNAIGQHYGATRRADITITPFASLPTSVFPTDDKRRRQIFTATNGRIFTAKFALVDNWVPMARYPEVLLNRAEALVRQPGGAVTQEAVDLLNQVRNRSKGAAQASYTLASFASTQAFVDAVLQERRLELAFEGHRLYDLLRNRQGVPAHNGLQAIPYGDPRLVFPIPAQEVRINTNLVQNPGY